MSLVSRHWPDQELAAPIDWTWLACDYKIHSADYESARQLTPSHLAMLSRTLVAKRQTTLISRADRGIAQP